METWVEISRYSRRSRRRFGIHIIAASGHYVEKFHPNYVSTDSIDALASRIASEVLEGIEGTEVKAGMIGEIGTSSPMTSQEEKVVRAAARAQLQTGAPLNIHLSYPRREGLRIVNILEDGGGISGACHLQPRG